MLAIRDEWKQPGAEASGDNWGPHLPHDLIPHN